MRKLANWVRGAFFVVAIAFAATGCADSSKSPEIDHDGVTVSSVAEPDETVSTQPPPAPSSNTNIVLPAVISGSDRITCVLDGGGESYFGIGRLRLDLPEWWKGVEYPVFAGGYNDALDSYISLASTDPRGAMMGAADLDFGFDRIPGTLGQVLMEANQGEVAGCVLGAAAASVTPQVMAAAFRLTYLAHAAGEAYEKTGEYDAARAWYEYAGTNPGGSADADYYAQKAREALKNLP